MATYTGSEAITVTLVASQVDTITLTGAGTELRISQTSTTPIYIITAQPGQTPATPTVGGAGTTAIMTNYPVVLPWTGSGIVINVISAGTGTVNFILTNSKFAPQGDLALKADLISPTFTGIPSAPTAPLATNTTQIATTAFVLANGGGPGGGDALTSNPLSQFASTTSAQLAGVMSDETGSGSLVFATSPTLFTPYLGTPASGIATNLTGTASGLTAGNVTTNANLTGDVTSVGNATSIAAGVIVDADINASAGIVDTKLATIATASKVSNSATTAASANTASAIVARDASGNFSAGTITAALTGNASTATTATTVTTNANLTGGVTSVGNAATVVTNANLTGDVTSVGNATTLTNAPVIAKVLTGYVSGSGTVAATDTILQAIQKLNGNDATNANLTGGVTSVGNAATVVTNANLTGHITSVGNAAVLGSFTSAQLLAALTDETGTGANVFAGSPTFTGTVTTATITGSPSAATTTNGANGIGYMGLPQNGATTGAYGVVAADAGTHIYSTATRTVTIPANSSIAMPVGTTIVFVAATGATVTISITSDTMYLAGTGTVGSRSLAPYGVATAIKITSTTWIISGNGLT